MGKAQNYHEFRELPAYTAPIWKNGKVANDADPYKWSGANPPPPIGAKVKTYVNGLGNAVVLDYFAEYGWLGVKARLTKPPKWWRDQTRDRGDDPKTTPAHFFGLDLEPRKGESDG